MLRIHMDNCCFNRPFDGQGLLKVRLETQAKLGIQQSVLDGRLELAWSFVMEYENDENPFADRRNQIEKWRGLSLTLI